MLANAVDSNTMLPCSPDRIECDTLGLRAWRLHRIAGRQRDKRCERDQPARGTTHCHQSCTSHPRSRTASSNTTTIARLARRRTRFRKSPPSRLRAVSATCSAYSIRCCSDHRDAPAWRNVSVIRPRPILHSGAGFVPNASAIARAIVPYRTIPTFKRGILDQVLLEYLELDSLNSR